MPPPGVVEMGTGGGRTEVRVYERFARTRSWTGREDRGGERDFIRAPGFPAVGRRGDARDGAGAGATRASALIGAKPNARGFDAREGGCGAIAYLAWGRRAAWSGAEIPRAPSGWRRRPRGRQPPGWRRWPSLLSRACGEANGAAREEHFRFVRRASERERCARRCLSVCGAPSSRRRNATFGRDKTLQARAVPGGVADVHGRRGLNASRAFEDPAVSNRAGYFLTDRTRNSLSSDRSNAVFRSTHDQTRRSVPPSSSPLSSRSKSSSRGDRIGGTWCASGVSGSEAHAKRHDEDRGGPVDDQEAARGHAHPHQGEHGDDRERDRNLQIPEQAP